MNTEALLSNIIILLIGLRKKLSANLEKVRRLINIQKESSENKKRDLDNVIIDEACNDTSKDILKISIAIASTILDPFSKIWSPSTGFLNATVVSKILKLIGPLLTRLRRIEFHFLRS